MVDGVVVVINLTYQSQLIFFLDLRYIISIFSILHCVFQFNTE